jgi:hypothetical protein
MNANKKYKDTVFVQLFSNEIILREVYNAIAETNYDESVRIEINTRSDVLFQGRKNDISFVVDNRIVVLIEHQSTINENMPLRLLIYIVLLYEKIIELFGKKAIYREKLIKIPRPEFYVFYNGTEDYPPERILRLSDAFECMDGKESPALELTVKVININKGINKNLEQKSETLSGYIEFIAKAREILAELTGENTHQAFDDKKLLDEAIKRAIQYCKTNNILRDFLTKLGSEVNNMLFAEWNLDDAKEVWQEEAWEEGMEKGWGDGIDSFCELIEQGYSPQEARKILKNKKPVLA